MGRNALREIVEERWSTAYPLAEIGIKPLAGSPVATLFLCDAFLDRLRALDRDLPLSGCFAQRIELSQLCVPLCILSDRVARYQNRKRHCNGEGEYWVHGAIPDEPVV